MALAGRMDSGLRGLVMTRDGPFMIEDGEVKHPVKNLRFTPVDPGGALRDLDDRRETEIASEFFFSASRAPALKIDRFAFTGKSDH